MLVTYFLVAASYAETVQYIVYCFVWVTPSTKSANFGGSRYLVEGFSARDEIWQLDRGGLAVRQHPHW